MKNVAIVTCIGKSNFGNRLQNYALQKVLEDYNFDVETLINTSNTNDFILRCLRNLTKKELNNLENINAELIEIVKK